MECKLSSPLGLRKPRIVGNAIVFHNKTVLGEPVCGRNRVILLVSLFLIFIVPIGAYGSPITVNIELDYPLLRQLLIRQLFKPPLQNLEILNDPSGCNRVVLNNPRVNEKPPGVEIVAEASADLGVGVLGSCTRLLHWEGLAGFAGRPIIETGATSLRFEPIDGWLANSDGKRVATGRVWQLAMDPIRARFSRFRLDLNPSIKALEMLLPEVLPRHSTAQVRTIIDSLQLNGVQPSATGLNVSLSFRVQEVTEQNQPEAALSAEELRQWDERWQMMDALFTFAVKHYVSVTESEELHSVLQEVLLDSRYRLRDALTASASRTHDPVRRWFLDSWKRLAPIIRRIGLEKTGQEPLLWISLLTATDALDALDRFGPAMGLEISAAGLRRLARLVEEAPRVDPLRYEEGVDAELRQLFQLPELPEVLESNEPSGYRFDLWPIRAAWAGAASSPLDRWVPDKEQLREYLPLVARLLKTTAEQTLDETKLEAPVDGLFPRLVAATAWQESCWRQYVVENKKMQPLRSSTGDVGLMQINERIWRGFYDTQKLRWDITYNARAGAEILLNYLVKYGLKQGEHKRSGGLDNLARASYSAYNGIVIPMPLPATSRSTRRFGRSIDR